MERAVPHCVDLGLLDKAGRGLGRVRAADGPVLADLIAGGRGLARGLGNRADAGKRVEPILVRLPRVVLDAAQPVEPEAVHAILFQPEPHDVLHVRGRVGRGMVPVEAAPAIGMAVVVVMEEGIEVGQLLAGGAEERRVHPVIRMVGPGMVEHHIQDDRNAPPVGRVDQRLELVRRAVQPLRGHVEDRVVAPRAVAGELADGHQFERVDAERLQVVQPGLDAGERPEPLAEVALLARKIANGNFVDDEVTQGRALPAGLVPCEVRRCRKDGLRSQVIPTDFARIRVCDEHLLAGAVHRDSEPVFYPPRQRQRHPEVALAVRLHGRGMRIPAVEVTDEVDGGLEGCSQEESDCIGAFVIPERSAARHPAIGRGRIGHRHVRCSRRWLCRFDQARQHCRTGYGDGQ